MVVGGGGGGSVYTYIYTEGGARRESESARASRNGTSKISEDVRQGAHVDVKVEGTLVI